MFPIEIFEIISYELYGNDLNSFIYTSKWMIDNIFNKSCYWKNRLKEKYKQNEYDNIINNKNKGNDIIYNNKLLSLDKLYKSMNIYYEIEYRYCNIIMNDNLYFKDLYSKLNKYNEYYYLLISSGNKKNVEIYLNDNMKYIETHNGYHRNNKKRKNLIYHSKLIETFNILCISYIGFTEFNISYNSLNLIRKKLGISKKFIDIIIDIVKAIKHDNTIITLIFNEKIKNFTWKNNISHIKKYTKILTSKILNNLYNFIVYYLINHGCYDSIKNLSFNYNFNMINVVSNTINHENIETIKKLILLIFPHINNIYDNINDLKNKSNKNYYEEKLLNILNGYNK